MPQSGPLPTLAGVPILDVQKWYGGGPSVADNTTPIRNACADALNLVQQQGSSTCIVLLRNGIWNVNTIVQDTDDGYLQGNSVRLWNGVILMGENADTTILQTNVANNIVYAHNSTVNPTSKVGIRNITIGGEIKMVRVTDSSWEDMVIAGNLSGGNPPTYGLQIIGAQDCFAKRVTVHDMLVTNGAAFSIVDVENVGTLPANDPVGTRRITLVGCAARNLQSHGFRVQGRGTGNQIIITNISVANPCVVTTSSPHGLSNGNTVNIYNTITTPTTIGSFTISNVTATTFTIPVNVTVGGAQPPNAVVLPPGQYLETLLQQPRGVTILSPTVENWDKGNGAAAAISDTDNSGVAVIGGYFHCPSTTSSLAIGVFWNRVNHGRLIGCMFEDIPWYAVQLNVGKHCEIASNSFINYNQGNNGNSSGIYMNDDGFASVVNNGVHDNHFAYDPAQYSAQHAIQASLAINMNNNARVSGNNIHDNTADNLVNAGAAAYSLGTGQRSSNNL